MFVSWRLRILFMRNLLFVLCFLLHNGEISKYIGKEMMTNMALLFSAVTVTANNQEVEFLVGGIPREFDDLEGWTAFDNFMEDLDEETEVSVHAKAYLYGGEETYKATPEEVAYFMKRIEMDDTFLSRCDNIEDVEFTFGWSPDELFGMKM